jgi:cytochrome b561
MPATAAASLTCSTLYDSDTVYGWISILLHWSTAVLIIALWFIGKGIMSASAEEIDARRSLHVSIAGASWLLILLRVAWRLRAGHPRIRGQTARIHQVAKSAHYLMVFAALLMLVSGPFLVWADGRPVSIFGAVTIPGPVGASESVRALAWSVHESMAVVLAVLVVLHIGGALKHLMFHSDDTIVRMLWPARPGEQEE